MSIHPVQMIRKIIHIDMDCFYAAVEVRENPALRGQPVAVGGLPEQRGVVAACNYEARAFGVHSAMPMSHALRKCPRLVRLPVRMALYREVSAEIGTIFREYTDLIEPLSLDEAYLDVTGQPHCHGSASLMAEEIRGRIFERTGLTASAGVGPNKLIAKIASDWRKPNGQTVVSPRQVAKFVKPLPVEKIFGVGKVTAGKLHRMGVRTCEDLQAYDPLILESRFGSMGARLYEQCRGIDERPVDNNRKTKSLSIEDTFARDLPDLTACQGELEVLYPALLARYARKREKLAERAKDPSRIPRELRPRALVLKMRFNDFVTTTAQQVAQQPDLAIYRVLCERAWIRGRRPVRLLGLGIIFV